MKAFLPSEGRLFVSRQAFVRRLYIDIICDLYIYLYSLFIIRAEISSKIYIAQRTIQV